MRVYEIVTKLGIGNLEPEFLRVAITTSHLYQTCSWFLDICSVRFCLRHHHHSTGLLRVLFSTYFMKITRMWVVSAWKKFEMSKEMTFFLLFSVRKKICTWRTENTEKNVSTKFHFVYWKYVYNYTTYYGTGYELKRVLRVCIRLPHSAHICERTRSQDGMKEEKKNERLNRQRQCICDKLNWWMKPHTTFDRPNIFFLPSNIN